MISSLSQTEQKGSQINPFGVKLANFESKSNLSRTPHKDMIFEHIIDNKFDLYYIWFNQFLSFYFEYIPSNRWYFTYQFQLQLNSWAYLKVNNERRHQNSDTL